MKALKVLIIILASFAELPFYYQETSLLRELLKSMRPFQMYLNKQIP